MTEATRDDMKMILKLYEMRREETMRKARNFMAMEFYATSNADFLEKYPAGSEQNAYFRQTLSYWDMVATFVKRGLINKELFFETNGEFHFLWVKARAVVQEVRKLRNSPNYYANLQELAEQHKAWMEQRAPGSSAFIEQMNKPPVKA